MMFDRMKLVPIESHDDVRELFEIYEKECGRPVDLSPLEAYELWSRHSDSWSAGWLDPPSGAEVVRVLEGNGVMDPVDGVTIRTSHKELHEAIGNVLRWQGWQSIAAKQEKRHPLMSPLQTPAYAAQLADDMEVLAKLMKNKYGVEFRRAELMSRRPTRYRN